MEHGTRVVVTGGGNGIGRALAHRLAREGAAVVVADVDERAAVTVAREVGGHAVVCDVATASGMEGMINEAREWLGDIDWYFGNAGVEHGGDLDTPDAVWHKVLDVNMLAHVRAARLLVPGWIGRGGGRFVLTASAAGLLTMVGNAPYSVSKHAAVAFAEWLSVTYGDQGIVVQAVCPLGVDTAMLDGIGQAQQMLRADAMSADEVADAVWEGLQRDDFLILPHPQVAGYYANRAADTDRWLAGMRRLNRSSAEQFGDH